MRWDIYIIGILRKYKILSLYQISPHNNLILQDRSISRGHLCYWSIGCIINGKINNRVIWRKLHAFIWHINIIFIYSSLFLNLEFFYRKWYWSNLLGMRHHLFQSLCRNYKVHHWKQPCYLSIYVNNTS